MQISRIEWFAIEPDVGWAAASPDTARPQAIVVFARDRSEIVGFGEVAVDHHCQGRSFAALSHWLNVYAAAVAGHDIGHVNALHEHLDRVSGGGDAESSGARAALEMAVFDLIGKVRGCPVHDVLGGGYHREFELYWDVDARHQDAAAKALAAVEEGYSGIKLAIADKVPVQGFAPPDAQQIAAQISAVLMVVGSAPHVDAVARQSLANIAKSSMVIEELLRDRFHANVALQQPLHKADLEGHSLLRRKLPIPITLDASITSPEAMIHVVRQDAADRVVLDLWRVGGLQNAMRIVSICESAAIGVTVSGHCVTAIGRSALCHLAASIRDRYPLHFSGQQHFADDTIRGGAVVLNGRAALGAAAGLGVEVDERWVRARSLQRFERGRQTGASGENDT